MLRFLFCELLPRLDLGESDQSLLALLRFLVLPQQPSMAMSSCVRSIRSKGCSLQHSDANSLHCCLLTDTCLTVATDSSKQFASTMAMLEWLADS